MDIHGCSSCWVWRRVWVNTLIHMHHCCRPLQDTWDVDIHMMRLLKLLGLALLFTHLFACMSFFVQVWCRECVGQPANTHAPAPRAGHSVQVA